MSKKSILRVRGVYNYYFCKLIIEKKKKLNYYNQWKKLQRFDDLFARYVCSESVKILSLYYHELIEKLKNMNERNTWWLIIICYYMIK